MEKSYPLDPWTMASVSTGDGGNTLQLWRMNDLIYRPEAEALAELERHKVSICGGRGDGGEVEQGGDGGARGGEGEGGDGGRGGGGGDGDAMVE